MGVGGLSNIKKSEFKRGKIKMEGYSQDPNARITESRRQVNEVVDVMRDNVSKMMEREEKLSDIDARADNLQQSSIQFASTSRKLKKKMWWENMKMKIVIGCVLAALLLIIIIVIVEETKGSGSSDDPNPTTTKSLTN